MKDFDNWTPEKAEMTSKLREELKGKGDLYRGDTLLSDVSYEVYVFQGVIDKAPHQTSQVNLKSCYGFIYGPGVSSDSLGQEVTLHLEDGRYLKCVAENWNKGSLAIICENSNSDSIF